MFKNSFIYGQYRVDLRGIVSLDRFVERIQPIIREHFSELYESTIEDEQLDLGKSNNDLNLYNHTKIVENKCYKFKNESDSESMYINKSFILFYFTYETEKDINNIIAIFVNILYKIAEIDEYVEYTNCSLKKSNIIYLDVDKYNSYFNNEESEFKKQAEENISSFENEDFAFVCNRKTIPVDIYIEDNILNAYDINCDIEGYYDINKKLKGISKEQMIEMLLKLYKDIEEVYEYLINKDLYNAVDAGKILETGGVLIG